MASSPPSPHSPVLRPAARRTQRSDFYLQARSLSELALHNLSVADMFEARYSEVTDDDLLDSLAPLGTGVVEEAEQMFHDRCHQALESYAATPAGSPPTGPAPSAASSPPRSSTSSASRSRSMADRSDPSYFALGERDRLYSDGGESSYSSGVSTPSLWTDGDNVSSYAGSGFGSPLPSTPANEKERFNYSCTGSPTLAPSHIGARSSPAAAAENDPESVPLPPTIATRRSGISMKLDLPALKPLPSSPSITTLRDRAPALLSRTAKSPVAEPALSPLSAPSSPCMASTVSGLSRLTVLADGGDVPQEESGREGVSPKKPSWLLDLEQQVAPTDGIKLKRKPSHVYAF